MCFSIFTKIFENVLCCDIQKRKGLIKMGNWLSFQTLEYVYAVIALGVFSTTLWMDYTFDKDKEPSVMEVILNMVPRCAMYGIFWHIYMVQNLQYMPFLIWFIFPYIV